MDSNSNLILTLLRNIPFLKTLTEEEHQSIVKHITLQYFPAHYHLFEKGDLGSTLYIIKSGVLRIYNEQGELATLKDGDFFGEMALIENKPHMAGAETLSDCEIFVLNKEDFAALLQKNPEIAQKVEEAYENRKLENA